MDFKSLLAEERSLGKNPAASYSVAKFEAIDKELESIKDEEKKIELREEAKKLQEDNKDSIILVYVAERILISIRPHEYNLRLNNMLLTFYEAGNWDVVKYIGSLILSHSESSKALRVLADVAEHQGDEDKKWEYYERFVKADSSDKDIIIMIADHYEAIGDRKAAMNYYQRALLRLQKGDDAEKIKDVFRRLLENGRSAYPFYSSFTENMAERDPATGLELYRMLLSYLSTALSGFDPKSSEYKSSLDSIIEIARRILAADGDDEETKKKAEDTLRLKYASSSRLDECLRKHKIMKAHNAAKALDAFEKDIAYSSGTYVLQKATRRIGLIVDVKGGMVAVRYSAADTQNTTLESAYNTLVPLTKQNIKVIKKGVPAQKIKANLVQVTGLAFIRIWNRGYRQYTFTESFAYALSAFALASSTVGAVARITPRRRCPMISGLPKMRICTPGSSRTLSRSRNSYSLVLPSTTIAFDADAPKKRTSGIGSPRTARA